MAKVKNFKIGNTSYDICDKEALHQYSTMPEVTRDNIDTIVQYVGVDSANYENSHLYKSTWTKIFTVTQKTEEIDITIKNADEFYEKIANMFWQWAYSVDLPDNTTVKLTYHITGFGYDWQIDGYSVWYEEQLPGLQIEGLQEGSNFTIKFTPNYAWKRVGRLEQVTELTPAVQEDKIVQYIGSNTAQYKNGHFYKNTREILSVPYINDELYEAQYITVHSIDASKFKQALEENYPNKKATAGFYTFVWQNSWELDFPDNTAVNIDSLEDYGFDTTVEEYIQGATLLGFVYTPNGETYTVSNIRVSGGDIQSASIDDNEFSLIQFIGELYKGRKNYNYNLPNGAYALYKENNKWYLRRSEEIGLVSNSNFIGGLSIRPSTPANGSTVEFNVAITYKYTYSWQELELTEVYNGLDSFSETKALSAYMGNVLAERIDNIGTIGRFLAMWDADTGIARYLDVGFAYDRGDYFIVATVNKPTLNATCSSSLLTINGTNIKAFLDYYDDVTQTITYTNDGNLNWVNNDDPSDVWDQRDFSEIVDYNYDQRVPAGTTMTLVYLNEPNYKPYGDEYTGPSTTVEDENDIRLSDMYYYDGTRWIYMASHEKQIAIDAYLDKTSLNPVENRIIANKVEEIETKQEQIENNITTINNILNTKQDTLISGTNIKTINGNDILGSGNIEIKAGGGGSAGLPVIANVDVRRISNYDKTVDYLEYEKYYRGQYHDIIFTTNMDRDTLIEKMNDLYVCILKRQRGFVKTLSGSQGDTIKYKTTKYNVMNDRRVKSTKRMYCWLYGENFDMEHFHTSDYYFYYTEQRYNDDVATMLEDNPEAYTLLGMDNNGDYTTSFNTLRDSGATMMDMTGGEEYCMRYEAGDIDTFINKNHYFAKTNGTRMVCKECFDSANKRYFAWCLDWEDTGEAVYINIEYLPEFIPEHFVIDTDIVAVEQSDFLATYTPNKERKELDICYETNSIDDIISSISLGVENLPYWFKDDGDRPYEDEPLRGSKGVKGHYWFDHPVMPVRIADCEVLIDDVYKDQDVTISGTWMKFKDYIKLDTSKLSTEHILFRFPYPSDYLALRMCGWEKNCLTHPLYDENNGVSMRAEIGRVGEYEEKYLRNPFGKNKYRGSNRMLDLVQFNLLTADEIAHNKLSQSTGVNKKLAVLTYSGQVTTTLAD